ncbi:MAG: SAVED domain-containing protein [Meiothermus sp.]|nr:SAVED domain-containing protein [Meiothermus sp.]
MELWARAAGRCEYRGCGKPLYLEPLTKARLNLAHIAHIVAAQPGGPRGDPKRSKLLQTDLDNLMLACRDHHALCDFRASEEGVERHSEAELRAMKRDFEAFVENALAMLPNHETRVLIVLGRISGNTTRLTKREIREALWERRLFPLNDEPDAIKTMQSADVDDLDPPGWAEVRRRTELRLDRILEDDPPFHVSVFALARIPLLAVVGYKLGDKVKVQTFHPTNNRWPWPDPTASEGFDLIPPSTSTANSEGATGPTNKKVILKLEASGIIGDELLPKELLQDALIYAIRFAQPRLGGIRAPQQVEGFGAKVRQFYETLAAQYGEGSTHVHVFPAVPPALAVEFGRVVRHHFSPTKLYERRDGHWVFTLEINVRE